MNRHALARVACVVLVGSALACAPGCGSDDRPASWAYIHAAIIAPNCATVSCHSKDNAQSGVQLYDAEAAYAILVGRACDGNDPEGQAPRNYVSPGHPEQSRLMYLLLGEEVRKQMPPDRPLPDPDIDLISRWIENGAACN